MNDIKVALVHDYIKEYGGAERVLESLHEVYPHAPVFTSVYLPEYLGPHKQRFEGWDIRPSFAQHLPFKAKLISPLRIITPLLFQQFDFSEFDVVIVSATGAYTPNMIRRKVKDGKTKSFIHICYCHTPPRYLYGFATAREWKKNIFFKVIGEFVNHFLRLVDFSSSQRVDYFISNSKNVKRRIEKFYRKSATVIYPPVDIHKTQEEVNKEKKQKEYFLAGGRLARPKHIDVIVASCTKLNVPLKVFGKAFAGYGEELQELAGDNVEFVGEVSDEEKIKLMQQAQAFIFASMDEDFGITPVEVMGTGTPVIAYKSGGVLETVVDGETGLFFDELSVESLSKAIKHFKKMTFKKDVCMSHAEKFSKERFKKEIKEFVESKIKN